MRPPAGCTPKLVASLAIILLVACTMLAMDGLFLETFKVGHPTMFVQPLGVRELAAYNCRLGLDCTTTAPRPAEPSINQSSSNGDEKDLVLSNFGSNINLSLHAGRQREAPDSDLKYILHWNEAYGDKKYAFGFGREPFYENLCPETRCVTTEDREGGAHLTRQH
jgi:hypothetical protein